MSSVFSCGENFIAGVKMLYAGAPCLVKVGGGLYRPVAVGEGSSRDALSGQLYTLAIEPLLTLMPSRLQEKRVRDFLYPSYCFRLC